ncbi:MAG: SpoIIE family protein phosphatase [Clostridia bacterium]|nr:SpoIIE family protein phosphatase [Clostridia bacterium]
MKQRSVSVRINLLILVLVIVICVGLVTAAYWNNSRQIDDTYKSRTSQTSSTVASLLDSDQIMEILNVLQSEEYQTLRAEADAADDSARIEQYLAERGILDLVRDTQNKLSSLRDLQEAKYIYLIRVMDENGITFCDPDEPLTQLGIISKNAGEFGGGVANQHIPPTVSRTDFGWLCSAYDPVKDRDGHPVCLVGVDIDMTDVMNARHSFLWFMLGFSVVMGVLAVALGIWQMKNTIVKPLKMLSTATDEFADLEDYTREKIIDLPIRTQDEIGDLYRKTRTMQTKLLDYMENLAQVTMEKEHISTELNVANRIQADMLPRIFPAFPERSDFTIYASMDPAKEVGGDLYDFFLVDEDHLAMVVADVSGKGVPAALFMVIAKTLIKNRGQMGDTPSEILRNVNNQLCEGNDEEFFVTVWMGILELSTGKGWAVNAGHEHPVIRRNNGLFELVVYRHSPAVAVMPGINFRQHEFQLNPGDTLFVYTDGVPEATNAQGELYGNERMLRALNKKPDAESLELMRTLRSDIDAFVGDAPQFDDITMLMLQYMGPQNRDELKVEARRENFAQVLSFLDERLERCGCPMKAQTQLDIAVEEIFVNVASYAYADHPGDVLIRLRDTDDPKGISITFMDQGAPFDPLIRPDPDVTLSAQERSIGGLGIYLVKKSMDDVRYSYENNCNILTLTKYF